LALPPQGVEAVAQPVIALDGDNNYGQGLRLFGARGSHGASSGRRRPDRSRRLDSYEAVLPRRNSPPLSGHGVLECLKLAPEPLDYDPAVRSQVLHDVHGRKIPAL